MEESNPRLRRHSAAWGRMRSPPFRHSPTCTGLATMEPLENQSSKLHSKTQSGKSIQSPPPNSELNKPTASKATSQEIARHPESPSASERARPRAQPCSQI